MEKIFTTFFLLSVYLFLPSVTEKIYETFMFEATLSKEQVLKVVNNSGILQQIQGRYRVALTSVNFTSNTIYFNVSWHKTYLYAYGDPLRVADLSNVVFETMKGYRLEPIKLRMNFRPAPPVSVRAIEIQTNRINVTWKHPRNFDVTVYRLEIRNNTNTSDWSNVREIAGAMNMTMVTNLKPETTYYIRMESVNKYGTGEIKSKELKVTTLGHLKGSSTSKSTTIVIVVVVIVIVIVTMVAGGIVYYRRRAGGPMTSSSKENPYVRSLLGIHPSDIYVQDNRTFCMTAGYASESNKGEYFSWNEISRDCLTIGDVLGDGEFGEVKKAILRDANTNTDIFVAVKSVKEIATDDDKKELLKELKLMADLSEEHPHIVNLIGACSHGGPLWVIVEFCEHGNLLSHLKKNRRRLSRKEMLFMTSLTSSSRLKFAYEVSKGMAYLQEKKIVHRDLAARNVLLGKDKIAKVSDFGLSRDIYEMGLYQKKTAGKLPVKWMAIESLQEANYTLKSDIWSFGILVWEIESAGMVPYPGISGRKLLPFLQDGNRLSKPAETSPEMYTLMKTCWKPNPEERPSFKELETALASLLEQNLNYLPVCTDSKDESGSTSPYVINYAASSDEETEKLNDDQCFIK